MHDDIAFIGFGEAGMAFALPGARGFDLRSDAAKRDDFAHHGVTRHDSAASALAGAGIVFSLVTADQALAAAREAAAVLAPGTLWLDMNSVAPDTKRAGAAAIEAAGGRYVDVAVMAPALPARLAVPLLVAGPHAAAALEALAAFGFTMARPVEGGIGAASAIKMIRSVMVKGIEALSAECALAAATAGVLPEVVASLDASWPGADWARRFDYNLDRMLHHGTRRAAEMREVVATLDALGTGSPMALATVERQAALGKLGGAVPEGLAAKLARLRQPQEIAA